MTVACSKFKVPGIGFGFGSGFSCLVNLIIARFHRLGGLLRNGRFAEPPVGGLQEVPVFRVRVQVKDLGFQV